MSTDFDFFIHAAVKQFNAYLFRCFITQRIPAPAVLHKTLSALYAESVFKISFLQRFPLPFLPKREQVRRYIEA